MKTEKLALLALLLVVVSLSGCLGGGGKPSGISTGVIVKDFYPGISEIYSGDDVIFTLIVENVGGETAGDVKARLFGLGTDWVIDDKEQTIGDLSKSQPDDDIPGGTGDVQWEATSPSDLKVDNSYTAIARLTYTYRTTALANLKVYSYDYLRSNQEEAEEIMQSSGVDTFTVTDSPLDIELAGVARPLIYKENTDSQASLTFLIENIGQGKPYLDSEEGGESNMKIRVNKIEVDGDECTNDIDSIERLPRAGKKSIPCKFDLPEVEDYETMPVEIVITYDYWIDADTDITVRKSLFLDEDEYVSTFECDDHEECCWDEDGPCGYDKGAKCDSDGECRCGESYEDTYVCPPKGQ